MVIGTGGRQAPGVIARPGFAGNVEGPGYGFDAAAHALDFYESLEGMRVSVSGATAVGPALSFGEIALMPDGRSGAPLPNACGGVTIGPDAFNPQRIIIDDRITGLAGMPRAKTGDALVGVEGVIDYSFGNYKLLATSTPTLVANPLPRETAAAAVQGQLSVASYNVLNLAGNDPQTRFDGPARQIITNLRTPDIIALQEIQDDNGAVNDGTVTADLTFGRLVDAIAAAGGPVYQFSQIDPANNAEGGAPGANIRVGFLYTPATVTFVGASRVAPGDAAWADAPDNFAWEGSRVPLAMEVEFAGERLVLVNNHLKSKGGDEPLFGRFQPPTRGTELQREAQAEVLGAYVEALRNADPDARIILLGDLNDFQFSTSLDRLETAGLQNLMETLPEAERYSYVFDGNAQALDHVLVTANLAAVATFDVVRLNAEYAFDDLDRFSDHDPLLVRFQLAPIPEPSTWALFGAGLAGLIVAARRRA